MFVNLHAHSEYSIADGLFGVKEWAKVLKDRGYKAHALTDHGTLAGVIPFYKAMKDEGLIPIVGCEFYFTEDPSQKEPETRKSRHLILLAKNYDGFKNLLELSRLSYLEGFYYKPRIGIEWLKKFREGLVCLSACQGGVLSAEIWEPKEKERLSFQIGLERRFQQFVDIFQQDFYVEFQGHEGDQARFNQGFYNRLKHLKGFQPVITNDCHYINQEHALAQSVLKEVSYGYSGAGESFTNSNKIKCDSLWLKKPHEIFEAFRKHHEYLPEKFVYTAMAQTAAVFEKCKDFSLPEGKRHLPKFKQDTNSKEFFKKLVVQKLKEFFDAGFLKASKADYIQRFEKEYAVISKYCLEDYFLIVWDLIRFASSRGIFSGLGRGSAAGSFICYLLKITKIDPLEYKLLFERFLNENRCSVGELPDIDLDFESERRGEIKKYIFETYGVEKVTEIGTYGRRKFKTCLIDFAKAMKIATHQQILKITTSIDSDDFKEAIKSNPDLERLLVENQNFAFVVSSTMNQVKSQSIHPAGLVICSEPVHTITPIKTQKTTNDEGEEIQAIVTQAEDKYVISQGLMKLDILGLKEYDIIRFVLERSNSPLTVDDYVQGVLEQEKKLPNEKVWQFFQEGKTQGVFQFESDGMRALLRQMIPTTINDLIAANALFRPGCLKNGWHIQYCNRKNKIEKVEYIHPDLEAATGDTYGTCVYQEQFMEIIHRLGGVSLVDSDNIRSALGKKDAVKLAKFKSQFVDGASVKLKSRAAAEGVWDQIEKASSYAFNKSHSAAYSVLAYISQFLKVNYPAYFWAAQFEWDARKNNHDDLALHRRAAFEQGVGFVLPRLNLSKDYFDVDKNGRIVWGLIGIKGIAKKTAKEITAAYPCRGFDDFFFKVNKSKVRINHIESLIYAGFFDEFEDRKDLIQRLYALRKKPIPDIDENSLLAKFRDSMGFFEQKIKVVKGMDSALTEQELSKRPPLDQVSVGGMISYVKQIKTKNGDPMAFASLVDLDEEIDLTFFFDQWMKYKNEAKVGQFIHVEGTKSNFGNRENSVEVKKIQIFS